MKTPILSLLVAVGLIGLPMELKAGFIFEPIVNPTATYTYASGISGSSIVGSLQGPNTGFIYDGTSFSTVQYPEATQTIISGINGNTLYGAYVDKHLSTVPFYYDGVSFNAIPKHH